MRKAKSGDKVKVHVTGKLDDGKVFAKTQQPLEFKIGEAEIIAGVQDAVIGMEPEQSKSVTVSPEAGYGTRDSALIQEVNRELLPDGVKYEVGNTVEIPETSGKMAQVKVVDVSDSSVTLDLNHPLAGKALTFDITLLHIF